MEVGDLIKELEKLPNDMWIDAMFSDGDSVYRIVGVSQFELSQGRSVATLDIEDDVPLRAV